MKPLNIILIIFFVSNAHAMLSKTTGRFLKRSQSSHMRFNSSSLHDVSKILGAAPTREQLKKAKEELLAKLHVDPEPGASWRSCQVTALSCMIDLNATPSITTLIRYLLDVEEDGCSPTAETIQKRLRYLDFSSLKSKTQAEKLIKLLQQMLRQDMATKLDIVLEDKSLNSGDWCIKDRPGAFKKVLAKLEESHCKIALAIYPGTPRLNEVRSLEGAEFIIPYAINEQGKYCLDKSGEYLQMSGMRTRILDENNRLKIEGPGKIYFNTCISEEEYKEARKTARCKNGEPIISHIPRLKIPEGEKLFLLHLGFEMQNECHLDYDFGNIISKLKLEDLEPLSFMLRRFTMLDEREKLDESALENLPFSHLSLFHFSYIPAFKCKLYEQRDIFIPNSFLTKQSKYFEPKNERHHPLLISELPHENTTKTFLITKAEQGLRYTLKLSGEGAVGEFWIEKWQNDNFEYLYNDKERQKYAIKFLKMLNDYHEIYFCHQTRIKLLKIGITPEWINRNLERIRLGILDYHE